MSRAWEQLAEDLANAMNAFVMVGVRPMDKGWFAHCDGTEIDSSGPAAAVEDLARVLRRKADQEAYRAKADADKHRERVEQLASIEGSVQVSEQNKRLKEAE